MMAGRNSRFEYEIGEAVLCFEPDPSKARVLYDAKVIDRRLGKDPSGKKAQIYLVHFTGWNSSWDREVCDNYLLRNTDDNRELMRKLADTAKKFRNRTQRRQKINLILHRAFGGSPPQLDVFSDSDGTEDESDTARKSAKTKPGQEKKRQKPSLIEFEIPDGLKIHIEDDFLFINKNKKLTKIPAKPCVIDILESFMKTFCVNYLCDPSGGREKTRTSSSKHTLKCSPDKCISLCKEFVDSLRIIFDFTLPIILLYAAEQQQYESAMKDIKYTDLASKEKETVQPKDPPNKLPKSSSKSRSERTTRHRLSSQNMKSRSPSPTFPTPDKQAIEIKEKEDEEEEISPRRITRRAALDLTPSISLTSQSSDAHQISIPTKSHRSPHHHVNLPSRSPRHRDSKATEEHLPTPSKQARQSPSTSKAPTIPIASRTRQRSHSQHEVLELSAGPFSVKMEPHSESDGEAELMEPPDSNHVQSVNVNGIGPSSAAGTESLTIGSSRGREDAMDRILGWQLLPAEVRSQGPVTPSQIYGIIHLLRMFVKLPELLKKMHMKDVQLQVIHKFIHHCLQYLVDHQAELLNEQTYIKA